MAVSQLPDTMNTIELNGVGGPEVQVPGTRPVPVSAPGEVLIKVAAAGVNGPIWFNAEAITHHPRARRTCLDSKYREKWLP